MDQNEVNRGFDKIFLYVGCNGYNNKSEWGKGLGACGLHCFSFDRDSGAAKHIAVADESLRVGDIVTSAKLQMVYAAERIAANPNISAQNTDQATGGGNILAYRADQDGLLAFVNSQYSFGLLPHSLALSSEGNYLLVANFGDEAKPATTLVRAERGWEMRRVFSTTATVSIAIKPDGSLGDGLSAIAHTSISQEENEYKQYYAHPSCVSPAPIADLGADAGQLFLTCDSGCDSFHWINLELSSGKLRQLGNPVLSDTAIWPQYFCWHPQEKLFYCTNGKQPSIDTYSYDGTGKMTKVASIIALDVDMTDRMVTFSQGQLICDRNGEFLYSLGSTDNKADPSVEHNGLLNVFRIGKDGSIAVAQQLKLSAVDPRGIAMSPNGRWLAIASPYDNKLLIVLIGKDGMVAEYAQHELKGAYRVAFLDDPPAIAHAPEEDESLEQPQP